jgi:hypothetical protein
MVSSESQLIAADVSTTPAAAGEGDAGDWAASSRTLSLPRVSGQRAFPRWVLPGWAWSGLASSPRSTSP